MPKIKDAATYIRLRNALDSFRDLALAEFALSVSVEKQNELVDFVADSLTNFHRRLVQERAVDWKTLRPAVAEKLAAHALELDANVFKKLKALNPNLVEVDCPPGMVQNEQGQCVPINLS